MMSAWKMKTKNPLDVIRATLTRKKIKHLGTTSVIAPTAKVFDGENITIGEDSHINDFVILSAKGGIIIGDNVHISNHSAILTEFLDFKIPRKHKYKKITIGSNVWIASHVVVGAGVTIGRNSVIGASSTVLSNIPANVFAVGSPAKVKRKLKK